MNPRVPRFLLRLAVCTLPIRATPAAVAASSAPPVTGSVLPGLAAVDPAMLGLLGKHACPGPQLAVAGRGYGFADRAPHAPATLGARLPTCGTSRHAART